MLGLGIKEEGKGECDAGMKGCLGGCLRAFYCCSCRCNALCWGRGDSGGDSVDSRSVDALLWCLGSPLDLTGFSTTKCFC